MRCKQSFPNLIPQLDGMRMVKSKKAEQLED